ncbi:MAG: 2-dehydropantoate 2-reductase [Burkholderiales bacterium]|nr:2-dehydropantoate 2-reductase [Burkholderiales bacterium]
MKIAIMGSGGVGGFVGARLAHAGCDVRFVARGEHLAAMLRSGLCIRNAVQGDIHVPSVRASADPAALGPVDLVLIAVKLGDTAAAAQAIGPLVGPDTVVLSLQNGVTKDDLLRREFGAHAVIGGVTYVATRIAGPGVIEQTGTMQRVVIGEYDGRASERVRSLHGWLLRAGLAAEISADIQRTLWEKFVFLVGLSSATATMRVRLGPILAHPRTRAFLLDVMRETVVVGRALGVALPADYAEQRLEFAATVPQDMTSSLHHDLEAGRALEVEWLAGAVVTLGREHNVPTPLCRAVWDILALHAHGRDARFR